MQNKLFATLITALLVMLMAGSAMCATYDSNVTLENKDASWQPITTDDITATVDYNAKGAEFEWHAYGTAAPHTEYALIYYADKPNRFTNWGGNNPGALIGIMTTDSVGAFDSGDLSVDLGMDMPHINDFNADPDPDYCNNNNDYDDYVNCWGAKLWIVPTVALPDPYPGDGDWAFWNADGILFETNLIRYCRSCYAAQATPATATFSIGDVFGTDTVPIVVTNATNAGSVDVTLTYDPSIVTVTSVGSGDMSATFDNIGVGQVRIGAYHSASQGLSGEFTLATVSFVPTSINGSCNFNMTVTTYKDATPCGRSMPYDVDAGVYCSYLNGDVNGDGLVDMSDVMYLAKHIIGISGFENIIECAAEVSGNGGIPDTHDVMYLAKYIIGITSFEELN